MIVSVLVEISFSKNEKTFDYLVPKSKEEEIMITREI